jgi:hypothetical protein
MVFSLHGAWTLCICLNHTIYHTKLILLAFVFLVFCEEYKLWSSSLQNFLQSSTTPPPPCIKYKYYQHPFLKTVNCVSSRVTHEISHPVHAITAHRRRRGITPLILNLGTGRMWVISFTLRPLHPQYLLYKRLGGRKTRSGCYGGIKISCPWWE